MKSWDDKPIDWGRVSQFSLSHIYFIMQKYEADPVAYAQEFEPGSEFVMGHVIPPFQRSVVWEEDRMIKFIESLVQRIDPGTWTFHQDNTPIKRPDGTEYFARDLWLIDGLQRFTALERFFHDEFPVYGKLWSELGTTRQRGFLMPTSFPAYIVTDKTDLELREMYDLKNFGGIAHKEEERALPSPR